MDFDFRAAAEGATVVFATTYLDEAARASNLFLLGGGKLLAAGTPNDVISHTPGVIFQSPISNDNACLALASPQAWRRDNTVFLWDANPAGEPPEGFETAPGDLENTSIALLLDKDCEGDDYPDLAQVSAVSGEESREFESSGAAKLFAEKPAFAARHCIGYVAQGLGLYPSLSALENLDFAASVHGVCVNDTVRGFARQFGRRPISELPLGAKRILAYLAATLHNPELLVLDEPKQMVAPAFLLLPTTCRRRRSAIV